MTSTGVRGDLPAGDATRPVVVGAAILDGDRVLATQRGPDRALPLAWEFPGGKVEPGETEPEALRRECREELGVEIAVGERVGPEVEVADGTMVLKVWTARTTAGDLTLHEHVDARWLTRQELYDVAWAEPDRPVVDALAELLG